MKRKTEKEAYQQALSDLEAKGFSASLYTIKIGTLGHWLHSSRTSIAVESTEHLLTKKNATTILDTAAKKVINAAQIIFRGRLDHSWAPSRAPL